MTLDDHLAKASEHLRADKLAEAEREVAAALALRQDDLRARNLKGLVLFRGARYDEARALYLELSSELPDDAAIRLNLGLVELRMGRYADAAASLRRVVAKEPENARAQAYLGLALMRTGDLHEAREAFLKGEKPDLARQVEERLSQGDEAHQARAALREAAATGAAALDDGQPFSAVELDGPGFEARRGAWQLRAPGEAAPLPAPEGALALGALPLLVEPARPVAAFATARLLRPPVAGEVFGLAEGGLLLVRVDGKVATRTIGAVASTGSITFEPLMRRVRAQATDEPFGEGGEAMFMANGQGVMVVAPRGAQMTLLALTDDIVYARETAVFSFEEGLNWENGRVPGAKAAEGARIVQFRGSGRLVLKTQRRVFTLKVDPEASLFVDAGALVGWVGRVVPRVLHNEQGEVTPYVEASGEGVLIIEEPPPLL